MQCILTLRKILVASLAIGSCCLLNSAVPAYEILGTGTESLIGNDLTDIGDDGDPEFDDGYDAVFDSSDEPGFGGGEFAFNVFDNILGPGNDKWCCGIAGGISEDDPIWVSAQLPVPHFLTNFTVSSANDVPERDPIHWAIQGSNDGQNYTDIYTYDDDFGPWDERLQVIEFKAGDDFPEQTESFDHFRMATFNTINNPGGAYFQVGEIEFFGRADGVVPPIFVGGEGTIGQRSFEGDESNKVFGPEMPGVSGWFVKMVDSELTIDSHTIAEEVLDDEDGVVTTGSYNVVDLAGGGGSFPENLPFPAPPGEDFAVRAEAEVVIPVGTWTIGFGSDDGGQITIPGVTFEFDLTLNNDSFDDDQIRFEGNRGHGWTVGVFEVTGEPLETTITASMHERGGGDSFEIAVIDGEAVEAGSPDTDWQLLGDDTFGWSVKHTGIPLVSADLSAEVGSVRVWQFDVDGDSNTADQFVMENPDPEIYTSILSVDGVTIEIKGTGSFANGDFFKIIDADRIVGTPTITSADPAQNWVFDANSGLICLGSCPANGGGDFNGDGAIDIADVELLRAAVQNGDNSFDVTGDGIANVDDIEFYVSDASFLNSWIGDSNGDGEFNSTDFVVVFQAGQYEDNDGTAGTIMNSVWATGDWNGDGEFNSSDFVLAFQGGGFEVGPRAATSAVPEPSSNVLALLSVVGMGVMVRRRRNR